MTPREELVYKLRSEGMIYRLIGEQLGVTGVRANQIYKKCLRKNAKKGEWEMSTFFEWYIEILWLSMFLVGFDIGVALKIGKKKWTQELK